MKRLFKGTPGPWLVRERCNIVDEQGESIADVWFPVWEEADANARLIAAAPELLIAIENFRMIVECNPDLLENEIVKAAFDYAGQVITKALGNE